MCGESTQHIDMGTNPDGDRVCGFCLRMWPHRRNVRTREGTASATPDPRAISDSIEIVCYACGRRAFDQDGVVLTHGVLGEPFCPASDKPSPRAIRESLTPKARDFLRAMTAGDDRGGPQAAALARMGLAEYAERQVSPQVHRGMRKAYNATGLGNAVALAGQEVSRGR